MPNLLRPLRLDPDGSSRPRTYAYNLYRSLQQMEKEIYLAATNTPEELEAYR